MHMYTMLLAIVRRLRIADKINRGIKVALVDRIVRRHAQDSFLVASTER